MPLVRVNTYIHAPCERVFEVLSDHEGYVAVPLFKSARLLRPGLEERNGRGAVRELRALGLRLVEEITGFDRPHRFDYRIIDSTLPIEHVFGRVALQPRGEGCEVDWCSEFRLPVPLLGALAQPLAKAQLVDAFTTILLTFKERLEEPAARGAALEDRP